MKYLGECLCGGIKYEVQGEIGPIQLCHCSRCRRAQGSAYAANAVIKTADFFLSVGQDLIKEFASAPDKMRAFCSNCGSPIYSRMPSKPEVMRLRIGTLSTPLEKRPSAHIFATSKAEWDEITDDIPQYETRPEEPLVAD